MIFSLGLIIYYLLFVLIMNLNTVVLVDLREVWKNSYWLANSELLHSTKHYYLLIH